MNNDLTGLIIDSTGIQDYIFSSNKLKLNLGASYIIEHLLMDKLLKKSILNELNNGNEKGIEWKVGNECGWDEEKEQPLLNDKSISLAYSGGGRCLLFCKNNKKAEGFANAFSLEVMQYLPGITLSATTLKYNSVEKEKDKTQFQSFMTALNKQLGKARSEHHIISSPISPGYVRKDTYSDGYTDPALTKCWKEKDVDINAIDKRDTSASTLSKLKYSVKANNQHECDFLGEDSQYSFPTEFNDVCMEKDQGFLAIVHVDGNGIGSEFQKIKDLKGYQSLSNAVKEIGKETIQETVKDLIGLLDSSDDFPDKSKVATLIQEFIENPYLPFRPIISGGDDITFVTDGHLGLYLAERCIKNFIEVTKSKLGNEFHACAGVAIVKRKYPFARAYHLAEELIKSAKKESRVEDKESDEKYSYIDMYISKSGISGSLDYIRSRTHERKSDDKTYRMDYGPYLIASENPNDKCRPKFKKLISRMNDSLVDASSSKVQQLRESLYASWQNRRDYFKRLQQIDNKFSEKLKRSITDDNEDDDLLYLKVEDSQNENEEAEKYETPWIDAIDFMDFYPWDYKMNNSE